jgi:hypothetical protein
VNVNIIHVALSLGGWIVAGFLVVFWLVFLAYLARAIYRRLVHGDYNDRYSPWHGTRRPGEKR